MGSLFWHCLDIQQLLYPLAGLNSIININMLIVMVNSKRYNLNMLSLHLPDFYRKVKHSEVFESLGIVFEYISW